MRYPIVFFLFACWLGMVQARPVVASVDGNLPVRLQSVQMRTEIAAGMARTTLRMEVANPNPRPLEATLQLPLGAGQQVSGFALDIGGLLRPAVPVDKARGQQVFEAIQRRKVDPALLEHTAGNQFRLRIYPVPGAGRRLVELTIVEALAQRGGSWRYRPPLHGIGPVPELSVDIAVRGPQLPQAQRLTGAARFEADGDGYRLVQDRAADHDFEIAVPAGAAPQLLVQEHEGERYFLAQVPVAPPPAGPRPMPRVLGLLWDSSGSGAHRNHAAELAALGRYLQSAGNIEVALVRLRDRAEPARMFRVTGGDWSALRKELQATVYDGASALGGWPVDPRVEAWLLVSDGLHNYGVSAIAPAVREGRPLHVLNSTAGADLERLSAMAARHGGVLVDLSGGQSAQEAASMLARGRQAGPSLRFSGARDIVEDPAGVQDGWLRIAGRVERGVDKVVLERGGGRTALTLQGREGGFAALAWARYTLHQLGAQHERHAEDIRTLGKSFGIPTRNTSLIVLETLDDYLRYDIVPPAELRAAFMQARTGAENAMAADEAARLDQVARKFADKVAWWNRRFHFVRPAVKARQPEVMLEMAMEPPPAVMRAAAPPPVESSMAAEASPSPAKPAAVAGRGVERGIGIRLQAWEPDAPYMDKLRMAPAEGLYAAYLAQKPLYAANAAYFVDAADLLRKRGQRLLALRVLSNLAEIEQGNRHILRLLAYRLMEMGEPRLALPLLRKVRELAPEEPQSFRDLGLAMDAAGHPQQAVELLYTVVKGEWDWRFADVDMIAVAELNAIVARNPGLDTRRIDRRLLKNLPLDLRVVLSWDADNTDIDLRVTDPHGEVCFYGNRDTGQGGRMSADFTGGYGPEEFSLRRARPGKYKVHVSFFGHAQQMVLGPPTLQVHFQSGFGTAQERRQTITLRLDESGDQLYVGEFEVK